MVLNEEKRARLADVLARRQGALGGASGSAVVAPIVVVPLATAQASPTLTPLEKKKGAVAIDSDDDEDTGRASSLKSEGWPLWRPHNLPLMVALHCIGIILPVPPLLAPSSCLKVVGRAHPETTKCHLLLSCPLSSNTPSRASKRKGRQRLWTKTH